MSASFAIQAFPGGLDKTYGNGGIVTTTFTNFSYLGNATLQADGKLVVVGSISGDGTEPFIARYNTDGTLDSTFGTGGVVTTHFQQQPNVNEDSHYNAVAIQPDGKITASGSSASSNNTGNFYAARYNPDGSLDTSFGNSGKVVILPSNSNHTFSNIEGQGIVRQPDGKYVVGLGGRYGGFGAIRLLPNGTLDPTFGYGGSANYQTSDPSSPYPTISGNGGLIILQPNGKIILPGTNADNLDNINGIRILRLTNYARNDRADFDRDGRTDLSVVRSSAGALSWYYLLSSNNQFGGVNFGASGDLIVSGDFDGDEKTDIAVFRPSNGTWYLLQSKLGFTGVQFGQAGDIPVPADYDGDGKTDIAVFRPSNGVWYILGSTSGFQAVQFGQAGDTPVAADYDGDGKADVAVFRPSNGVWYLNRSQLGFTGAAFGQNGDIPVPGDYDGDGKADLAVFRGGVWYVLQSLNNSFFGVQFGAGTDIPVPADFAQ